MSADGGSVGGLILAVALILFVWFILVPFFWELTAVHTETIPVRGIAGDIVEDLQGNLWRLKDLDRYTLAEIRPGTLLEIRWIGPEALQGPTRVSVENITWTGEREDGAGRTVPRLVPPPAPCPRTVCGREDIGGRSPADVPPALAAGGLCGRVALPKTALEYPRGRTPSPLTFSPQTFIIPHETSINCY